MKKRTIYNILFLLFTSHALASGQSGVDQILSTVHQQNKNQLSLFRNPDINHWGISTKYKSRTDVPANQATFELTVRQNLINHHSDYPLDFFTRWDLYFFYTHTFKETIPGLSFFIGASCPSLLRAIRAVTSDPGELGYEKLGLFSYEPSRNSFDVNMCTNFNLINKSHCTIDLRLSLIAPLTRYFYHPEECGNKSVSMGGAFTGRVKLGRIRNSTINGTILAELWYALPAEQRRHFPMRKVEPRKVEVQPGIFYHTTLGVHAVWPQFQCGIGYNLSLQEPEDVRLLNAGEIKQDKVGSRSVANLYLDEMVEKAPTPATLSHSLLTSACYTFDTKIPTALSCGVEYKLPTSTDYYYYNDNWAVWGQLTVQF